MTVKIILENSLYDCDLKINDMLGCNCYSIPAYHENSTEENCLYIDVIGTEINLVVTPVICTEAQEVLKELDTNTWKEKLANKLASMVISVFENMILRVGCKYHLADLCEGDEIRIVSQGHVFNKFDWLDLLPVIYMFYEVSVHGIRCAPVDAFSVNRKIVLKAARKLALVNFGVLLIFTYPIQIGRMKHLTKNKKIRKTLIKFHNMSPEKRNKILEQLEK